MLEIEETKTDTGGQDAHKVSAGLVHGTPPLEKEGQGRFADVCSKQAETDPSQPPFLKFLKEGGVFIKKNRQSRGVRSVAASLFVVISLLAGRASDVSASHVGVHSGARGGKLDRRQRPLHARLGDAGSELIPRKGAKLARAPYWTKVQYTAFQFLAKLEKQ
jgi:hypothetical protein